MSEVDPDPYEPGEGRRELELGGARVSEAGDPTQGGKQGQIGTSPGIAADEPDPAGTGYPVGGGRVTEESDAVPVDEPGPDA